jgi:hypothetical protein
MPVSSKPVWRAATASSRSSSLDRTGWRISTISVSFISLRDHWIAPMPMNSNASPSVRPRVTLEAPYPRIVSGLSPTSKTK